MAAFLDILGGLVGTFFIISVLSMLWKDNLIFRIGQQAIIGATIAHYILNNFKSVYMNALIPITTGQIVLLIPIILGVLMYTRLRNETSWIARYPTAVLIGVGTGITISTQVRGQIIDQMKATVLDLFNAFTSGDSMTILNNIIIVVGVVTTISFFLFTHEHKGSLGTIAKIGRVYLMLSLGANFSGELVWYLTQLIGRLSWIINTVIKIYLLGG